LPGARASRRRHKAAPDQIVERIDSADARKPGDGLAAARHHNLRATMNVLQMLAQPIVKLTHSNLVCLRM
jgi:hypothetical protein